MDIIKPNLKNSLSVHLKDLKYMKKSMEDFLINFKKRKDVSFKSDKLKKEYLILDKINYSIDYYTEVLEQN